MSKNSKRKPKSLKEIEIQIKHEIPDDEEYGIEVEYETRNRLSGDVTQLTDSLTTFYTPLSSRRTVKPVIKFECGKNGDSSACLPDDKQAVQKEIDEINRTMANEREKRKKKVQQPLFIDVDSAMDTSASTSSESPNRICNMLTDSLSPAFQPSNTKRRTVKKGEFLSLSGARKTKIDDKDIELSDIEPTTSAPEFDNPKPMSERRRTRPADIGRVVGRRKTQNSASAALFSSPEKEGFEEVPSTSESSLKRPRTPKEIFSPHLEHRKLFGFRNVKQEYVTDESDFDVTIEEDQAEQLRKNKKKKKSKKEKIGSTVTNLNSSVIEDKENIVEDGSIQITDRQRAIFNDVRNRVAQAIDVAESKAGAYQEKKCKEPRLPRSIRIGKFEIETWYSSPFPMEYIHVPVLYICEYCLKYVKTDDIMVHHLRKCKLRHPPGQEIYRKESISVFEVDGNSEKTYCQNLCLLSKLFLDHKTLFYDVEPFLFYVLTVNDAQGCHFAGYFSKEKYSVQKFNLSCIVTLPCYQKQGFGRFLIDFSYLLTRKEGICGTPERPLSDLGRISYASYWRTALLEWIHKNVSKKEDCDLSINEISEKTGIFSYDIIEVFDTLDFISKNENGQFFLSIDFNLVDAHWQKAQKDSTRIWIDEKSLQWQPRFFSPSKDNFRSPYRTPTTPKKSPATGGASKTSTPSGVSLAACGSTIKSGVNTRKRCPVGRNLKQKVYEEEANQNEAQENIYDYANTTASGSESSDFEAVLTRSARSAKNGKKKDRNSRCKANSPSKEKKRDESPDDDLPKGGKKSELRKGNNSHSSSAQASSFRRSGVSASKNGENSQNRGMSKRGKMMFEDSNSSSTISSESSSSNEDDIFDLPQKGRRGKPQKGRNVADKKGKGAPKKGKNVEKIFPTHGGNNQYPVRRCEVENSPRCSSVETYVKIVDVQPDDSHKTEAEIVPMKEGNEEEELATSSSISVADTGPPKIDLERKVEEVAETGKPTVAAGSSVTTSDNSDNSDESDDDKKKEVSIPNLRPEIQTRMTPMSSATDDSAESSRAVTPEPTGDLPGEVGEMINMGFNGDDDVSRFDAPSEENDEPPQLEIEGRNQNLGSMPIIENQMDDEAPPMLDAQQNAQVVDVMSSNLNAEGDEDDVPPQLSPNVGKNEQDEISEEQKRLAAMDRPPPAPVAFGPAIDEEEKLYHEQLSAQSQVVTNPGSFGQGPSSASSSHQMHQMPNSACQNMMTSTPQQNYSQGPGSIKQMTPGSAGIPSCGQIYNQNTPEQASQNQQQTFMSPPMGMPSSVSSVHSVHNSSMEMASSSLQHTPQQPNSYAHDIIHQNSQLGGESSSSKSTVAVTSSATNNMTVDPTPLQMMQQQHAATFGSPPASIVAQSTSQSNPSSSQTVPPASSTSASTSNSRSERSANRKRQQQLQQQQQREQMQQQLQMQQQMQQMQFPQNYHAGYSAYPYHAHLDPMTYQYWSGSMFPPYYSNGMAGTGMRMNPMAGATNPAWPRYPTTTPGNGTTNNQFTQMPNGQAPFTSFPQDFATNLYPNFYMKHS